MSQQALGAGEQFGRRRDISGAGLEQPVDTNGGKKPENAQCPTLQHEALPSQSKGLQNFLVWLQKGTQMGHSGCYPQSNANPPLNSSKMVGKGGEKGQKDAYRHR